MPAHAIRAPFARSVRLGRLDDARLAALAGTGDERAFEALYERHHRALLGFCRHLLRSREEGEDALQQTFLRAHRSLVEHGAPDDVRPWLFTIARNRCRTIAASRRTVALPDELEPATEGLGSEVQRRDDLRELLADLGGLPEDQRAALVLSELADLSHAEIGAVIGVPAAKVKALVFQARSRLIADREARDTSCADIRMQLATARGGELRRGPLRRHLKDCPPCREYRKAVSEQRAALALLLPVLPSAGLKAAVLGAAGGGGAGGGAAAAGIGAGASAGGLSGGSAGLTGLGLKLAVGATLIGGAGGGAVLVDRAADTQRPPARAGAPAAVAIVAPALPEEASDTAALKTAERLGGTPGGQAGATRGRGGSERSARARERLERRRVAERRRAQRKAAKRAERRERIKKAKRERPAKAAPPAYGRTTRPAKPLTPGADRPAARPAPRSVTPAGRPAPVKPPVVHPPKAVKPPVIVPALPVGPAKAFKPAKAPKTKLAP
jgi:RNA polymerase sigma factor (sigma-70 family)